MRSNVIVAFIICACCMGLYQPAHAQQTAGWSLEAAIHPGLATENTFGFVLGGDLRLEKGITPSTHVTLTTGFTHFFERDRWEYTWHSGHRSPYNVIPIKGGFKQFIGRNWHLGAEAGLGIGFEEWGQSFVWSPAIGYSFGNGLDLSLYYEDFTKHKETKQLALRLAYGLNFKGKHSFASTKLVDTKWRNPDVWALQVGLSAGASPDNQLEPVAGGDVRLLRRIVPRLYGTASVGFTRFFNQLPAYYINPDGTSFDGMDYENYYNIVPLKTGLEVFALGNLYFSGEIGIGLNANGNSAFVYSPGMGLQLRKHWDLGLRYDRYVNLSNANAVTLRLAYGFWPGR